MHGKGKNFLGKLIGHFKIRFIVTLALISFLLVQWNRTYNLTAVRDKNAMLSRHFLDCLSLLPELGPEQNVLDVGR